jgi:hypothetical protein
MAGGVDCMCQSGEPLDYTCASATRVHLGCKRCVKQRYGVNVCVTHPDCNVLRTGGLVARLVLAPRFFQPWIPGQRPVPVQDWDTFRAAHIIQPRERTVFSHPAYTVAEYLSTVRSIALKPEEGWRVFSDTVMDPRMVCAFGFAARVTVCLSSRHSSSLTVEPLVFLPATCDLFTLKVRFEPGGYSHAWSLSPTEHDVFEFPPDKLPQPPPGMFVYEVYVTVS